MPVWDSSGESQIITIAWNGPDDRDSLIQPAESLDCKPSTYEPALKVPLEEFKSIIECMYKVCNQAELERSVRRATRRG
jgi:hypothetical protein